MPPKPHTHVDAEGRECVKCLVYQPWSDFPLDRARKDGHRSRCKGCEKGRKKRRPASDIDEPRECIRCHGEIAVERLRAQSSTQICESCADKGNKWLKAMCYLVVHDPEPARSFFLGHFIHSEMEEMLEAGYWPPGMRFELWRKGAYESLLEVKGELYSVQTLEVIDDTNYVPRGDGVILKVIPGWTEAGRSLRASR